MLPTLAGDIFCDDELLVEDTLIEPQRGWDKFVKDASATPFPLDLILKNIVHHEDYFALWFQGVELMTGFLSKLDGIRGWDGAVTHQQCEAAKINMERVSLHLF